MIDICFTDMADPDAECGFETLAGAPSTDNLEAELEFQFSEYILPPAYCVWIELDKG